MMFKILFTLLYCMLLACTNTSYNKDESYHGSLQKHETILHVCDRTPAIIIAIIIQTNRSHCSEVTNTDLKTIKSLDLTHKALDILKDDDFSGLTNLELVNLSYNNLKKFPENIFKTKSFKLKNLNLSYNKLKKFPEKFPDKFSNNFKTLETLNLSYNNLNSFPIDNKIQKIFPNLTKLVIKGNSNVKKKPSIKNHLNLAGLGIQYKVIF